MPKHLSFENDYIVGGPANVWLTPNFRLSEYADRNGRIHVHRELVAAIQVLRSVLDRPLKIESLAPADGLGDGLKGRFAWVSAAGIDDVARVAKSLIKDAWFARVEPRGARVYVEMPDPERLPPLPAERALERALSISAGFETTGDPYLQCTGNFDGQGLSYGPLQVNFGQGSLQDLFRRFEIRDRAALQTCFGELWPEWQRVLQLRSKKQQVAWADALSRGSRKAGFDARWSAALQAVGRLPQMREETVRYAYDTYGRRLIAALSWLKGLQPIPIRNFRCLAALFDLCVQQGTLDKAHNRIRSRVAAENPRDEFDLVRIAVEERARTAKAEWQSDCMSRRLCILDRQPVKVRENGVSSERDNPNLYLVRNVAVTQVEKYLI